MSRSDTSFQYHCCSFQHSRAGQRGGGSVPKHTLCSSWRHLRWQPLLSHSWSQPCHQVREGCSLITPSHCVCTSLLLFCAHLYTLFPLLMCTSVHVHVHMHRSTCRAFWLKSYPTPINTYFMTFALPEKACGGLPINVHFIVFHTNIHTIPT